MTDPFRQLPLEPFNLRPFVAGLVDDCCALAFSVVGVPPSLQMYVVIEPSGL